MNNKVFVTPEPMKSPVLFLVFNRPDTTRRVFEAIRQAQPSQLFIAADGPREGKSGEAEKCADVRRIVHEGIDWDCEVKTLFRDKNLGCKVAVSRAIDWFFEKVEEGIILEDDCLPSQSFFGFCKELLEYYRENKRVMHISGDNFQFGVQRGTASYYFSRYVHIWGWATWKRAWKYYDVNMGSFKEFKESEQIKRIFRTKQEQKYWMNIFQAVYNGKINTWDYQWLYTVLSQDGLSIIPNVNLVSNIGFGVESAHTKSKINIFSNIEVKDIGNAKHPDFILADQKADSLTFRKMFSPNIFRKIKNKILRAIPRYYGNHPDKSG